MPGLEEACRPAEEQAARESAAEAALQPAEVSSGPSGPDPGDTTSVGRTGARAAQISDRWRSNTPPLGSQR